MSTKRIYTCNLCGNETREGEGVGVKWTSGTKFTFTVPSNAESHLCQRCVDATCAAVKDLQNIDKIRGAIDGCIPLGSAQSGGGV